MTLATMHSHSCQPSRFRQDSPDYLTPVLIQLTSRLCPDMTFLVPILSWHDISSPDFVAEWANFFYIYVVPLHMHR